MMFPVWLLLVHLYFTCAERCSIRQHEHESIENISDHGVSNHLILMDIKNLKEGRNCPCCIT